MTLRHGPGSTLVSELVTHPGTSEAGKTMIEKAVNESQDKGNNGVIHLVSLNEASTKFYRSLDFKTLKGKRMELTPSESHLWSQGNDGKWSLKELEDSGYLEKNESEPSQARGSKRSLEDENNDETPPAKRSHVAR